MALADCTSFSSCTSYLVLHFKMPVYSCSRLLLASAVRNWAPAWSPTSCVPNLCQQYCWHPKLLWHACNRRIWEDGNKPEQAVSPNWSKDCFGVLAIGSDSVTQMVWVWKICQICFWSTVLLKPSAQYKSNCFVPHVKEPPAIYWLIGPVVLRKYL